MPKYILFLGLLTLVVLAGCGENSPDDVVLAEPTVLPTLVATEPPTFTPQSTDSPIPEPSATSLPTFTLTPEPTDTPSPTNTPEPTETATPTAEPTQPPTAVATAVPPVAPPAPATDAAAVLREQLAAAILELNNYHWALREDFPDRMGLFKPTAAVKCEPVVNAHDHILSLFSVDTSAAGPVAQNAQAVALEGVRQFNIVAGDWTESCRQAMVAGNTTNVLGRSKYEEMTTALRVPDNLWNEALRMLDN